VTKGRNGEKSQDDGDKKKRRITVVAMILSEKVIEAFGLTAARFYQKIGLMQAHNNLDGDDCYTCDDAYPYESPRNK